MSLLIIFSLISHGLCAPALLGDPNYPVEAGGFFSQNPASIFLEALGFVVGALFVVCCAWTIKSYQSTPDRDRIADTIDRFRIQEEMSTINERPSRQEGPSLKEAPPAYFPRPPAYEDITEPNSPALETDVTRPPPTHPQ